MEKKNFQPISYEMCTLIQQQLENDDDDDDDIMLDNSTEVWYFSI